MAMAYRKKPVVVEAVQWTGENHAEMCEFIDPEAFEIIPRIGLVIHTLEGDHHASPGDYIIKGVNGEFYPCKPDIFAKTYESSTLTPPNEWVSVEERIPNFGKLVIATDGTTYGVAWLCSDCTWMVTMGYKSQSWFGRKITHWMPIPALPNHRPPEGKA